MCVAVNAKLLMDISGNMENKIKLLNSNLYAQSVQLRERQSYKLEVTWGGARIVYHLWAVSTTVSAVGS